MINQQKVQQMLSSVPSCKWWILLLVVLVSLIFGFVIEKLVFPSEILLPVSTLTSGLVNPGTLVCTVSFVIIVWGIIIRQGKIQITDLGWKRQNLVRAILYVFLIWLAIQSIVAIVSYFVKGNISINPRWQEKGIKVVIGFLISSVAAAAYEETIFRGFLLPQMYLYLEKVSSQTPRKRIIMAIVIHAVIWALAHLPYRISAGAANILEEQLVLIFIGILAATFYVWTQNIFLIIGFHALGNAPTLIFEVPTVF